MQQIANSVPSRVEELIRAAFTYCFPVHDLARTRILLTQQPENPRRTAPNVLHHSRKLLDHRAREVTMPNNDTLYSSAWLDLSAGPLLLTVPDMEDRYYSFAMMDVFTNNFACVGRRTTGTRAITFTIAGPDWEEESAAGTSLVRSPSNDVWLLGRVLVDGQKDLPAVHQLQNAMQLVPLVGNASPRLYHSVPKKNSPAAFLDLVNEALGRNPIPDHERAMVEGFASIGIHPGVSDGWQQLDEEVRNAWTSLLPLMSRELKSLPTDPAQKVGKPNGHWVGGRDNIGNYGDDYGYRAFICLSGLGALERAEAIYLTCRDDVLGERLSGEHRYRLHVPAGVPVDAFWSLSMYEFDADGRGFFVENPIGRYTIGDRTPGLSFNPDGSADLWLQSTEPDSDKKANWLPAPTGMFSLALRFYQPGQALLDRSFVMPAPERLDV